MQVWAITYDPATFTDEIYQSGLLLVDPNSQARIKRFYHREDACRCLIGRLLPRMLLSTRGVAWNAMTFAATEAGKPYITTPDVNPPIAFNISHDSSLVAMAFGPGSDDPPAFRIGVDVMKAALPRPEPFRKFVNTFKAQLTATETRILLSVPEDEGIRIFFWIWTLKEAYTKALGLGMGFDFGRIEYDFTKDIFTVDGSIPSGWRLVRFEIDHGTDVYQGVVAKFIGGDETTVLPRFGESTGLTCYDATSFVLRAVEELK